MKQFLFSIILILVTITAAEFVLRIFIKLPDPYARLRVKSSSTGEVIRLQNTRNKEFNFVFRPNELFPKDESVVNKVHINNFGFRHNENIDLSKEEFRIYAIGGSTTQGYDYPYEKTWCQVLEKNLSSQYDQPIKVLNGGTAGSALFDHLAFLQNRVIHLKPDLIVLFAGVNDLNLLVGDQNIFRFDDIFEDVEYISWYKLALSKTTLYKLWLNTKENLKAGKNTKNEYGQISEIPQDLPIQFSDHIQATMDIKLLELGQNPEINYTYYQKMLRSFIGICQANNIPLVLMSQPTTWESKDETLQKYHWMNKNKDNRFDKIFMQSAMDKMNFDMHELAVEYQVPHFKLEAHIPNDGDYFFDDCHFTPKGSILTGNLISKFIVDNGLIKVQ